MDSTHKLKKKAQQLAALERNLALEKVKKRKAETRRKIELGGLVIKARMDLYSKDVILGALVHSSQELKREVGTKLLYQSLGQSVFMENKVDEDGR